MRQLLRVSFRLRKTGAFFCLVSIRHKRQIGHCFGVHYSNALTNTWLFHSNGIMLGLDFCSWIHMNQFTEKARAIHLIWLTFAKLRAHSKLYPSINFRNSKWSKDDIGILFDAFINTKHFTTAESANFVKSVCQWHSKHIRHMPRSEVKRNLLPNQLNRCRWNQMAKRKKNREA